MKTQYRGYEIETRTSAWGAGVGVTWHKVADHDDAHAMPASFLTDDDAIDFAKSRIRENEKPAGDGPAG